MIDESCYAKRHKVEVLALSSKYLGGDINQCTNLTSVYNANKYMSMLHMKEIFMDTPAP